MNNSYISFAWRNSRYPLPKEVLMLVETGYSEQVYPTI